MPYGILGPLSVTFGGRPVAITAGRDRIVLAMLLLHAGRVLSVATLIDAVWGQGPPATARGQLQTCISRLRRALPPEAIESDPAGYRVVADEVDAEVFARLVAQGRELGDPALLRQALDLWRGDALTGIESFAVRPAAASLDEQRMVAIEEWARLELEAGRERDLIAELSALVERFPLRERLRGRLMTALARSGRQADALGEFRKAREVLHDELGLEPGAELQEAHAAILSGVTAKPVTAKDQVRCLPRTVGDFTGRADLIDRLLGRVEQSGPVILALDGMAGSGKTTLALHIASRSADRYPDAHLFVDLHGHSDREPVDPSAALLILLRQLGVDPAELPDKKDERRDRWRTELAGRRAILILDNAASSAQVADLLPASNDTLVLVTSRRRLLGLDGAHPESLPVLAEPEAVALLARIAGDRVLEEGEAAADLARRCGGLPLAIRLAGARLAHRPRWRVADLVRRIDAAGLPELAAEDRTVAGAFTLSYEQLTARARRALRLIGSYPGRLFDALAVAALTGLPLGEARDLLDDLVDVHLVDEPEPEVFRLHDLLREYAAALPDPERPAAVLRALDLELHAGLETMGAGRKESAGRELGAGEPQRPDLLAELADPAERFERLRPYLLAFVNAAVPAGRPEYAWQLPRAIWRWLWMRGYGDDIEALFTAAREVAREAGDEAGQATAANYLAAVHYRRGRSSEAIEVLGEAIRLRRKAGPTIALSSTLSNLAAIHNARHRWVECAEAADEAVRIARLVNDDAAVAQGLDALAMACSYLGRHDEALRHQRRRLLILLQFGDDANLLGSLMHLVLARRRAGRIEPAVAERSLRLLLRRARRLKIVAMEAELHAELGDLLRARGRNDEAQGELREAMEIFDRTGDRRLDPWVANLMAATVRDPADLYRRALELSTAMSQPFEAGRAHLGLGDCASDPAEAREHWAAAERIFTRLRVPERYEAAERLRRTPRSSPTPA